MPDGILLAYTVFRPSKSGRFPVALIYDGYCEGSGIAPTTCANPDLGPALEKAGYAVLGVNIRGTGCSGGTWNAISRQWGQDGANAVEWAADQPWSTGAVGMFGLSFPGLSQFAVAPFRPRGLKAIAPFQPTTDFYRDVIYPGGIFNSGFIGFWGLLDEPAASAEAIPPDPDSTCLANVMQHAPGDQQQNIFVEANSHPYWSNYWASAMPDSFAGRIDVPVLFCETWQDDEVGSRDGTTLQQLNPATTWIVGMNGYHEQCETSVDFKAPDTRMIDLLVRFFNRFVKDENNWFEKNTPHVQIWHEASSLADGEPGPRWVTTYPSWPVPVKPIDLYVHSGGLLNAQEPRGPEQADSYTYPGPSASTEDGILFGEFTGETNLLWQTAVPPGSWLAYTTPALAHDLEVFGSASANLWITSTATDTDFQVTLTEVRPDGQEEYVARGWLRASHRALDARLSTQLAPYYLDTRAASQPLQPGTPTLLHIQIMPFDHVFRAGSHIRLLVEGPTGETGGWTFDYLTTPAVNAIVHNAEHPSFLALGAVPGGHAPVDYPTCNTVYNQPCRTNPLPLPAGTLALENSAAGKSPGCPPATGRLHRRTLGLVTLGMTRAQARRAYKYNSDRGNRYEDFFCLTPIGVRVGYASPKLLKTLPPGERTHVRGRVVWASTANRFYSLRGVRPGARLAVAARRLRVGRGFHVGLNWWYFAPGPSSTALLKVRHGIVQEIGIADKTVTGTRRAQLAFIKSFS